MRFIQAIPLFLLIGSLQTPAASVIFIHPDGTGLGHWNAARLLITGPDGMTNWDRLTVLAAYRPHQKNWLSTTSHAGATVHAYGKKVHHDSFGMDQDQPLESASGKPKSILKEAQDAGIRTGTINSGHIAEPGTAVFATSSESRKYTVSISEGVMKSGLDVLFAGGETFLIPEGSVGHFGVEGLRTDGRNLIEEAKKEGYRIIYTREELMSLTEDTKRVIGIFAPGHTFNDDTEENVQQKGIPLYLPNAPTLAEMTDAALRILGSDPSREFFLIVEEEGSDNFSNKNNAGGMLEAVIRADAAIGIAQKFLEAQPYRETLILVGSDSDAGHPTVLAPRNFPETDPLPKYGKNGAPIHGSNGQGGTPFLSLPDAFGNTHPFGIAWATRQDVAGSVVAKASGFGSTKMGSTIDNTGIFEILHEVLFDSQLID